jgi:hypothetical protein
MADWMAAVSSVPHSTYAPVTVAPALAPRVTVVELV